MNRSIWCTALAMCATLSLSAVAADAPKRTNAQRAAAEREAAAARAAEDGVKQEKAEVAELEARDMPRSVVQERKLRSAPGNVTERLKAAEAYVLEAQDSPSKLDAAAEHVNAVLESNPKNVPALLLAGRISILRGLPAVAQANYQAAATADPGSAAAFLGIGDAWTRLGNDQQASLAYGEYRRLIGLAPVAKQQAEAPVPGQAPPVIIGPGKDKTTPTRSRR